jgi:two-component system CheB/CheR fusion protein
MNLAAVYKNNAIGVILSGTATDGTLGLKAIKAEGGITFAQDDSAKFTGMPQNAYDSGYVDFLLSPEKIADELGRLVHVSYTRLPSDKIDVIASKELTGQTELLRKILSMVKGKSGIDFFVDYKRASVYRRIVRRMALTKKKDLKEYHAFVSVNPREVDSLYDDILINVTNFFRDPDFFHVLDKEVLPALVARSVDTIRIWVAGCSTGEEAYSIAISLFEFLAVNNLKIPIQIFASDLDASAIEKARLGQYSMSAVQGLSQERLGKFFRKIDLHYQVVKAVREVCIFSQHNLLTDPPFSRMDLISCQNVLIYLETGPQERLLQTFHYALKPAGHLFLGKSETIGTGNLFEILDKKVRLFSRRATKSPQLDFTPLHAGNTYMRAVTSMERYAEINAEKDITKMILARYVLPCIVLNKNLMIIQFFGVTSPYLEPVAGKATLNVLKIIREELIVHLGSLFHEARNTGKTATKNGIRMYYKGSNKEITIEVEPTRDHTGERIFLVVFKETSSVQTLELSTQQGKTSKSSGKKIILKLEKQLMESRSLIRSSNEEYESTYEELQAYNEEVLSANEELQSVNEEMETSKEELQSAVEELTITNEELGKRNIELKQSQTYSEAIIETIHDPLLVLTSNLQVKMANTAFYDAFKLTPEKTEGLFIYELADHAWEIPALREHLNQLMVKKSTFEVFELRHTFPELGEMTLIVNTYRLLRYDASQETLILLSFNNVSELLKANKELSGLSRQLEEFTFISSHDLQEPLRKIQMFSSLLVKPELNLNPYASKYVKKIGACSRRMALLIKDLLNYSLLSFKDKRLNLVDLNWTMRNILEDQEDAIQAANAKITFSQLPSIYASQGLMIQLFTNLIENALKFGRGDLTIDVSCEDLTEQEVADHKLPPNKHFVAISVKDNGIGFDQEYISRMFNLFQRVHVDQLEGSGVGLAICRKIAEYHGGLILAVGKINFGATFIIILPV